MSGRGEVEVELAERKRLVRENDKSVPQGLDDEDGIVVQPGAWTRFRNYSSEIYQTFKESRKSGRVVDYKPSAYNMQKITSVRKMDQNYPHAFTSKGIANLLVNNDVYKAATPKATGIEDERDPSFSNSLKKTAHYLVVAPVLDSWFGDGKPGKYPRLKQTGRFFATIPVAILGSLRMIPKFLETVGRYLAAPFTYMHRYTHGLTMTSKDYGNQGQNFRLSVGEVTKRIRKEQIELDGTHEEKMALAQYIYENGSDAEKQALAARLDRVGSDQEKALSVTYRYVSNPAGRQALTDRIRATGCPEEKLILAELICQHGSNNEKNSFEHYLATTRASGPEKAVVVGYDYREAKDRAGYTARIFTDGCSEEKGALAAEIYKKSVNTEKAQLEAEKGFNEKTPKEVRQEAYEALEKELQVEKEALTARIQASGTEHERDAMAEYVYKNGTKEEKDALSQSIQLFRADPLIPSSSKQLLLRLEYIYKNGNGTDLSQLKTYIPAQGTDKEKHRLEELINKNANKFAGGFPEISGEPTESTANSVGRRMFSNFLNVIFKKPIDFVGHYLHNLDIFVFDGISSLGTWARYGRKEAAIKWGRVGNAGVNLIVPSVLIGGFTAFGVLSPALGNILTGAAVDTAWLSGLIALLTIATMLLSTWASQSLSGKLTEVFVERTKQNNVRIADERREEVVQELSAEAILSDSKNRYLEKQKTLLKNIHDKLTKDSEGKRLKLPEPYNTQLDKAHKHCKALLDTVAKTQNLADFEAAKLSFATALTGFSEESLGGDKAEAKTEVNSLPGETYVDQAQLEAAVNLADSGLNPLLSVSPEQHATTMALGGLAPDGKELGEPNIPTSGQKTKEEEKVGERTVRKDPTASSPLHSRPSTPKSGPTPGQEEGSELQLLNGNLQPSNSSPTS